MSGFFSRVCAETKHAVTEALATATSVLLQVYFCVAVMLTLAVVM
jgi:hypothetical protein